MVTLLAIIGALLVGLLVGLLWRGFVTFGDRRQLGILTEQMQTEHQMSMRTNQAIAQMRAIVREQLRRDRSA